MPPRKQRPKQNPEDLYSSEVANEIVRLREEHGELRDKRTVYETELKAAQKDLDKLKKEAQRDFGTSDVKKLEAKLKKDEKDNALKLAKYNDSLEGIRSKLEAIDEEYESFDEEDD